jgi:predicted dehydrogenase
VKRVLIIGSGGIGKRHIRGYLKTERATVSVVEPNRERREEVMTEYALDRAFDDLADAPLADFDLAVICAPAHVHIPIMKTCINADLPFMVEKPLSVTMDGVDEALAAAQSKGVEARVGYIRRVSGETQALYEAVQAGKVGTLKLAYMNASQEFPKYRPDYRETYYARPEMGGGAILDCASHFIDLLIWLMGEAQAVSCMYDRLALEGTETEDTCLITIHFKSGAMATLTVNQFQKRNTSTIEMIGTNGNLMLDFSTLKFTDDDSGTWKEEKDYMEGMAPMVAHEARFALQANAMLDAIEGKDCCLATLDEARENLRIALAAKQSWDEKRIISL